MTTSEGSFPTHLENPSFAPDEVLAGRFKIVRFIAAGGVGEIYEAQDLELGERVAVKMLRPESAGREGDRKRFRREIQLARRVTHPNVCRLYEVFQHAREAPGWTAGDENMSLAIMELLEGETLTHRLDHGGRLSTEEALPLIRQIAAGIDAAHRAGVIHRDLKSSNIVLIASPQGERAVVTDFGLARLGSGYSMPDLDVAATQTGELAGTPAYMAPEQLEGGELTSAVDVYSLGVVIYRMVTGGFPFQGPTPLALAFERLRNPPRPPTDFVPDLPAPWEKTLLRCLATEPAERFATCLDVVRSLEGVEGDTAKPAEDLPHWRLGRMPALAGLGALVMLAVLGTLAWWRPWRDSAPRPTAATAVPVTAAPAEQSIAVLGIESRGLPSEQSWLALALAEMIATELVGVESTSTSTSTSTESISGVGLRLVTEPGGTDTEAWRQPHEAGLRLGVDLVIWGLLEPGNEGLELELYLRDVRRNLPLASIRTAGAADAPVDFATRAGRELRQAIAAADRDSAASREDP